MQDVNFFINCSHQVAPTCDYGIAECARETLDSSFRIVGAFRIETRFVLDPAHCKLPALYCLNTMDRHARMWGRQTV